MWDGFTGVLPYVAFSAFLCFLVPSVPVWLGRRKIRAVAAGRPIRIRSRLRVDEPPSASPDTGPSSTSERGELVALPGGPLYFLSSDGPVPVLELPPGGTFERTLYARAGSAPGSGRRIVRTALVHRTPSGGSLRVETARGDSRALRAALQAPPTGRPAPRALPARLPVWCAVLAVLALLGAVPVASIAVFGRQVTAHVTSNTGDDYCGVGWADPGTAPAGTPRSTASGRTTGTTGAATPSTSSPCPGRCAATPSTPTACRSSGCSARPNCW